MKKLIVLSKSVHPEICGMSDYSYNVAKMLRAYYTSVYFAVYFLPIKGKKSNGALIVDRLEILFDEAINSESEYDILLNYTPTAYSRLGIPFGLIKRLIMLKKLNKNNKIFLLIHELWNCSKDLKIHHKIIHSFYAYGGKKILNLADYIATFTPEQTKFINGLTQGKKVHRALIGTNIIPKKKNDALCSKRISGEWVIFGLPHTRLWTLEKHMDILKASLASGSMRKLISIGPIDRKYSQREIELAQSMFGHNVLVQTGSLSPSDISKYLLASELAFIGQDSDSLNKSGTFASLAAHGVPVVCDVSSELDKPPGKFIIRPSELENDIKNNNLNIKRKALHQWFWENRSWESDREYIFYLWDAVG